MKEMACVFCESDSATAFYNFETTATMHSITPVKSFCEKIIGTSFVKTSDSELICESCYDSLNELDSMEKKIQEITEDLKKRYSKRRIITSVDNTLSLNDDIGNDPDQEDDDDDDSDSRSNCSEGKMTDPKPDGIAKIHFSDENDLKNILDVKFKIKEEFGDLDDENGSKEHDVSVLYDMMDAKNFEILIAPKKNEQMKKSLECNECSKSFKTKQELKAHSSSHSSEKPYICEVCGKAYRHKTALDIHVGMHNGINPFKCLYCNKSFTQKGALIRHVKIHTGEKPYQCEQCGKCFTHHTSFNIHKISHSGVKSYKCDICGLKLISTSHLKRHMRVHTGEKKYSCFTCGKRFAERYNLVSHQKLHSSRTTQTQKKKFRCEICDKTCPNKDDLEEHIMKDHSSTDDNYIYLPFSEQS
ncbi:hypothetical protein HHI36_004584 [Cryptolaemus montrouzieri]|uniref:C2H2-type domain-containing protein n=1 Tax=Cryptolaemus montrouzieri TaxID=559131 RepID=A0ABD2NS02_9CUCU